MPMVHTYNMAEGVVVVVSDGSKVDVKQCFDAVVDIARKAGEVFNFVKTLPSYVFLAFRLISNRRLA
jgi:hypothetical protein